MASYHPLSFLRVAWIHRRLILRLARRKIEARYRGSLLGSLWTIIQPLLMLAVYTFVFGTVFQSRWKLDSGVQTPFALILFSGMILFSIFAECANEAPGLMISNQTYIKQMRFPIEILAWVTLASALFAFAVNLVLLLVFELVLMGSVPWTVVSAPLYLVPLVFFTLGTIWMLSAAGVFLRDLNQIISVVVTTLLFLSPIFYPAHRIPEAFRPLYGMNPFVPVIEGFRATLFEGRLPDAGVLLLITAGGWLTAWIGFLGFAKTKKGFADVL